MNPTREYIYEDFLITPKEIIQEIQNSEIQEFQTEEVEHTHYSHRSDENEILVKVRDLQVWIIFSLEIHQIFSNWGGTWEQPPEYNLRSEEINLTIDRIYIDEEPININEKRIQDIEMAIQKRISIS